jgi:hypothetical protein
MNMRGILAFALIGGLCTFANAQWSENFDSYAAGSNVVGQGGWKGWANVPANGSLVVNSPSLSAPNSLQNVGIGDTVHEYSGYTTGQWRYSASVFAPTAFTAPNEVAWFILLSNYSDPGPDHWSVQLQMTSAGVVSDTNGGVSTPTTLVRGQWVPITVDINLDANTRVVKYNGITVATGTWKDTSGLATNNIGAVDLYANSPDDLTGGNTVPVFYDNLSLTPVPEPASMVALGVGALALIRRKRANR